MDAYGIDWSYFSLWKDGFLDDFTAQQVQALLERRRHHHAQRAAHDAVEQLGACAGDYNHNGACRRGRLFVWRELGPNRHGTGADSNLDGVIDSDDYEFWASRFGESAGSGATTGATVPEQATAHLLLLAAALLCGSSRQFGLTA